MSTAILWFRRDLRLQDNAILQWAEQHADKVVAVYIHSEQEEAPWQPGGASKWWLHHSLKALEQQLAEQGIVLNYYTGDTLKVLASVIDESKASYLLYNKLYEPHLIKRDQTLEQLSIKSIAFDSQVFFEPGQILNQQQLPYRVFTPFYKRVRPLLTPSFAEIAQAANPVNLAALAGLKMSTSQTLSSLELLDSHQWHAKLHAFWTPGESEAQRLLTRFITQAVENYDIDRDIPACHGTSLLSPYLHFGEISPRVIVRQLWSLIEGEYGAQSAKASEVFLKQLVWREFAVHVLWHFPDTAIKPMNSRYQASFWDDNDDFFQTWALGKTGVSLVDAGMQQLWQTGWMHNRVRMVSSSFLTKNLNIHWLKGARWFWDTLVDADLANNSLGWQWVAGCGVDAAPYFRVFNPETQAKRFDANLVYRQQWLPSDVTLSQLEPMVDLKLSREQALLRYHNKIRH